LSLPRDPFHFRVGHGCVEGALVRRSGHRENLLRPWRWHTGFGFECRFAGWIHLWLPRATPLDRRIPRSTFEIARVLSRVCLRELLQSPPYALGVAEFVLGRVLRSLRAIMLDGCLA